MLIYFSFCCSSETQQGIFDAVLKGHIDFDSDPWPLISDSAKDLIRKMLCSNPKERLTAHQVLCEFVLNFLSSDCIFNFSCFCYVWWIPFLLKGKTCLGHPWICESGVAPDRALDPAVLSRLKHFSAMNKLKKMALRVCMLYKYDFFCY